MALDLKRLPPRARSWNTALAACPGDISIEVPPEDIQGTIPETLRGGRLWSNGPGWNIIGERVVHPFDGHGYVRRYQLTAEGGLRLDARFVRTAAYADEADKQRFVHRGLATNPSDHFWKNLRRTIPRNVANTTVYPWAGRLLVGWEAGEPHALDPETLETIGPHTFGGLVDGEATLAHMHHDHTRGRLILCGIAAGRTTAVTFREIDKDESLIQARQGTLPGMAFAHDFTFSDRWYILGGNPLALRPLEAAKMLVGAGTLLGAVKPDFSKPGELILVPRDEQGEARRVRLPEPSLVVHFANAFEEDDGTVIVDACVFHRFDFGEEFGYAGPNQPFDPSLPDARGAQRLYRITVPPDHDEATWEVLAPHGIDFPRIHPHHEGQPTAVMVGACRADTRYSDPFDSIIRVDLGAKRQQPALWTAPENVFVGEPILVPGEPDHIVAMLSDGLRDRSTLVIFEADALARGPVAQVHLPLMPVAFHGDWQAPSDR